MDTQRAAIANNLLAGLSESDFLLLKPALEWVDLNLGEILHQPREKLEFAYFPTAGICSIIAESAAATKAEAGIVGREGYIGWAIPLHAGSSPFQSVVQMQGRGLRIAASALQEAVRKSPSLSATLLKFIQVVMVQIAQTALVNSHNTIPQRLARWLVMYRDRMDGPEFAITHEFLSNMLGVRRAGVSEALSKLEMKKTIRTTRGRIAILDHSALEKLIGGSYGVAENEYRRLLSQGT